MNSYCTKSGTFFTLLWTDLLIYFYPPKDQKRVQGIVKSFWTGGCLTVWFFFSISKLFEEITAVAKEREKERKALRPTSNY